MRNQSTKSATKWTPEEDHILRTMHEGGATKREIALAVGRTMSAVDARGAKLGLRAKRLHARVSVHVQRTTLDTTKPFDLGERDELYVRACLDQGGFVYNAVLPNGKIVTVRP